jgi:hypothetical protein
MKHLKRGHYGQHILTKVEGLVRSKAIPKPAWYDAVCAHPPSVPFKGKKPERMALPGDRLLMKYEARNPLAKREVVDLLKGGGSEHNGLNFVKQQMEVLKGSDRMNSAKTRHAAGKLGTQRLKTIRKEEDARAYDVVAAQFADEKVAAENALTEAEKEAAAAIGAERASVALERLTKLCPTLKEDELETIAEAREQYPDGDFDILLDWMESEEAAIRNAVRSELKGAREEFESKKAEKEAAAATPAAAQPQGASAGEDAAEACEGKEPPEPAAEEKKPE